MKKLLALCLSLAILGCASGGKIPPELADRPDGWKCTFAYFQNDDAKTGFYCNRMRSASTRQFFHYTDKTMHKAHAMPQETYQRYEVYLNDKYNKLQEQIRNCK